MHNEILILGGGLAGLAAAQKLTEQGRQVLLLEARDRLGGRVRTVHHADVDYPIEMGPEWLDSGGEIRKLLRRHGAKTEAGKGHYRRRTGHAFENLDDLGDSNADIMERLSKLRGRDRGLTQALEECCGSDEHAHARRLLLNYVMGFHAANPDELSIRWLQEVEENQSADVSEYRCIDGLDRLVDALRPPSEGTFSLRLNAIAKRVEWRAGHAEVTALCSGVEERFTADRVVITLPAAVLNASAGDRCGITFSPELTDKRAALRLIATGDVSKVVLLFDTPFWKTLPGMEDTLFIQKFDTAFPTWWTTDPVSTPLLSGWSAGPNVDLLNGARGRDAVDVAIDSLGACLDVPRPVVEHHLRAWHIYQWSHDPYAMGAYSWIRAGGVDAHRTLAKPVSNTLFFAGEATCGSGYNATMEGAVRSGWRAAEEVLRG